MNNNHVNEYDRPHVYNIYGRGNTFALLYALCAPLYSLFLCKIKDIKT